METKHTPGRWDCSGGIISSGETMIADARLMSRETAAEWDLIAVKTFDEIEANARLIAAAPDLLAALERIAEGHVMALKYPDGYTHQETVVEYQTMARAAIAKARA